MEITEVRIKLMESSEDRLRGFCSVTFDSCFVVRDLKIIDGNSGPFVAMPSRKLTFNCNKCHTKNHMRANYCNNCGQKLKQPRPQQGPDGRAKLYADIAHPINARCRQMIQDRVVEELRKEQQLAREPGYRSRYDESYDSGPDVRSEEMEQAESKVGEQTPRPSTDAAGKDTAGKGTARTDTAHAGPPKPHRKQSAPPQQEESSPSQGPQSGDRPDAEGKPDSGPNARDDFGKGIFD